MSKIRLGIPKGSLNTPGRGNTHQLFVDAGYDIRGYEPGKESDRSLVITNDPEIELFLSRPQSAPVELTRGLLDIAIIGEDWVREESVNGNSGIERIGDLEYGQTRLVIAVPNDTPYDSLDGLFDAQKGRKTSVLCFTEYPNLTRGRFMGSKRYQELFGDQVPLVQIRSLADGENRSVQIINSDGVTEGYIAKGADIVVDNTQSGRTLREYGLRELETIMESSAGLYAGPTCMSDAWKRQKAQEIFGQLYGVIEARRRFDVKFNAPRDGIDEIVAYLLGEGLCSNYPTIADAGPDYVAINIIMPRDKWPTSRPRLAEEYGCVAFVKREMEQFVK